MLVGRWVDHPYVAFADRSDAGGQLADFLAVTPDHAAVVLALPRGGVPVGRPLADALNAPLRLAMVRKLPIPSSPEMGFGAIALDGTVKLNDDVVSAFHIDRADVERVVDETWTEVRRRAAAYGAADEHLDLEDRTAYLVDDGLATGWSMLAGLAWARRRGAAHAVVAVPVSPLRSVERVAGQADRTVCLLAQRGGSFAVASFYRDFHDLSDDEVRNLLHDEP